WRRLRIALGSSARQGASRSARLSITGHLFGSCFVPLTIGPILDMRSRSWTPRHTHRRPRRQGPLPPGLLRQSRRQEARHAQPRHSLEGGAAQRRGYTSVARIVIDKALAGDAVAARFLLERLEPKPRGRPIHLDIPEGLSPAGEVVATFNAALRAMA